MPKHVTYKLNPTPETETGQKCPDPGRPDSAKDQAPSFSTPEIDFKSDFSINDNLVFRDMPGRSLMKRVALLALLTALFTVAITNTNIHMAMAHVTAFLVMHADDRVLATAMDMDPDALAYALNSISPGE